MSFRRLPKWRDLSGDGRGDLLALTSGGTLAVRTGTGSGGLGTGVPATGWPSSTGEARTPRRAGRRTRERRLCNRARRNRPAEGHHLHRARPRYRAPERPGTVLR
jgi:hypothetical protein